MTDNEQEDQKSTFKLLDEGTMFTGRHFWYNGEACDLRDAVGVWSWEDVHSVGTLPDETIAEMPGPRCLLFWRDQYLYLQADFVQVQRAWRNYRKAQSVRRVFPFSGIFPFSGN
jgi:hypothetical protein